MVLSQEHCCTIRKSGQDILGTKHPKFLTHPVLAVRKAWMVRPPTPSAKKETSQSKAPSIAEFSFGIQHNLDIIWILYCMNTFMRFMLWPIHCLIKESTFIPFHRLLPWWNTKINYPDLWKKPHIDIQSTQFCYWRFFVLEVWNWINLDSRSMSPGCINIRPLGRK